MSNTDDDCRYWRLTPIECVGHFGRISAYYGGRSRKLAERSINSATEEAP